MRRNVGIAGLQRAAQQREQFRDMGDRMAAQQLEQLKTHMATFKASLETFATQYRREIAENAAFRLKFQQMCAAIGVDPLASRKGYWGEALSGMHDFYYDLSVRVIEICLALRDRVGPLVPLGSVLEQLNGSTRAAADRITDDDVQRAIDLLGPLGAGYSVARLGPQPVVVTVPRELNPDVTRVALRLQEPCGPADDTRYPEWTAVAMARDQGWTDERAELCLELLVAEEVVWVDDHVDAGTRPLRTYHYFAASVLLP
ncbi:ESCRT II complex subunit Dot2 [Blastocladiella emersonii ATCC 22665]|nr:ESCRT II complex subunit Dot2 [Blastocladiella emersonii ATCC 22665]